MSISVPKLVIGALVAVGLVGLGASLNTASGLPETSPTPTAVASASPSASTASVVVPIVVPEVTSPEPTSIPVASVAPAATPTPLPTKAATPTPRATAIATPTPTKSAVECDPNYSPCIPYVSYDLDCGDIGFTVRVIGTDRHRLDRDKDGLGCE